MARPKENPWTYEVEVTSVQKPNLKSAMEFSSKDRHSFNNRREVINWMKENYTTKNRRPMRGRPIFIDTATGRPKRVGKVFGFWDRYYDNPKKRYFREDWVSVAKVKRVEGW
jgi:hypothetical protein